ncbi:MAG: hypothetical protein K6T65_06755 [Peptococcaceae bacterium]|nr:hypothetical protein [Peptococcaceae bacterium]
MSMHRICPDCGLELLEADNKILSARPKIVYVAHPLASDPPGNIEKARAICRKIAQVVPTVVPVSPLLAFSFLREPEDRGLALWCCMELLERCDELWLTGAWWGSEGCLMEKRRAEELGMPVSDHSDLIVPEKSSGGKDLYFRAGE